MITLSFTFSEVTPESAEQGDYSATGWSDQSGWKFAEFDRTLECTYYSAKEAAQAVKNLCGSVEASCSPIRKNEAISGLWVTSVDGTTDYRNGTYTIFSAHPSGPEYQLRALFTHLNIIK